MHPAKHVTALFAAFHELGAGQIRAQEDGFDHQPDFVLGSSLGELEWRLENGRSQPFGIAIAERPRPDDGLRISRETNECHEHGARREDGEAHFPASSEGQSNRGEHQHDGHPVDDQNRPAVRETEIQELVMYVPSIGGKDGAPFDEAANHREERIGDGNAERDDGHEERDCRRFLLQ